MINIKLNINQIKRFYAFIKSNIVTIIVCVAILCCAVFSILIFNENDASTIDENITYEDVINQRFAISNIHSLDPIVSTDRDAYYIDKLIFSSLFKFENDRSLSLDLAESYECDKSQGIVTITLKRNVYYHKGQSFGADDVIYTFDYINSYGKSGPYYESAQKIDSIIAKGNNEIKVYFKDPKDACLTNLTFPILDSSNGNDDVGFKVNGTGQYKVSKYNKSKYIELKPNKQYFGDIANNKLYFQIFPKSTVVENLLTSYEVTSIVKNEYNKVADDSINSVTCQYIPSNQFDYLGFNFKNKSLAKKELRQAIAYTINLDEFVEDSYGKKGLVSDSIYFPNYLGTENEGDPYNINFNKAIKLIKKLNLFDHNKDGYLDDIDGNTIEFTILVNKNDPHRMLFANSLSECLNDLQIKNNVNAVSWNTYVKLLDKKDFDLVIGGYQATYDDNLKFMFDKRNNLNFKNEKILNLVKELNKCNSMETYTATYLKLKNKLIDELPYYCICYKQCALLGSPNMTFEELPNYDNVYKGVSTWQFKKILKVE